MVTWQVRDDPWFSDAPTWYRNTYFQTNSLLNIYKELTVADRQPRAGGTVYPAKMVFGDGYKLMPLLTPKPDGTQKLHQDTLKLMLKASDTVVMRDY